MLTDGYYTNLANTQRKDASKERLQEIQKYIASNRYLAPNLKMYGIAKTAMLLRFTWNLSNKH